MFTRQRDRSLHLLRNLEVDFSQAGPGCNLVHRARGHRRGLGLGGYVGLLSTTLKIRFRLVASGRDLPVFCLDHTSS